MENSTEKKGPYGIWGWNTFLVIGLCANILFGALFILALPLFLNNPDFTRPDIADICQIILMGAVAIPIAIWAFKKDKRYPVYCAWWLGGGILFLMSSSIYIAHI